MYPPPVPAPDSPHPLDAPSLLRLRALVDPLRLRVLARVLARPADAESIAADTGVPVVAVNRALDALAHAGLVEDRAGGPRRLVAARADRIGELARALAALDGAQLADGTGALVGTWPHDGEPLEDTLARLALTPDEHRVLRSFLVDGRLTTIPAHDRKRQVILRFLLERVFTEDRPYPEKEVNQRLALFHPDVASLRRHMVDAGLMTREAGEYRRGVELLAPRANSTT